MSSYNIISSTSESTVASEYISDTLKSDAFQSEAQLEQEFINILSTQGYDYLEIHSEADLVANLRS